MLPTIYKLNYTPSSVILHKLDKDITWKPPEPVKTGPGPIHNFMQASKLFNSICTGVSASNDKYYSKQHPSDDGIIAFAVALLYPPA